MKARSSSREVRIRVRTFFLSSISVPKKGVKGHYWGT